MVIETFAGRFDPHDKECRYMKGLMFTDEMALAIVQRRKWETRRIPKVLVDINRAGDYRSATQGKDDVHVVFTGSKQGVRFARYPCTVGTLAWAKVTAIKVHREWRYRFLGDALPEGYQWGNRMYALKESAPALLNISAVRFERLHAITDTGAIREGVTLPSNTITMYEGIYVDAFKRAWEGVHGSGSWGLNPWVCVIEWDVIRIPMPLSKRLGID